jgi:glutaconyl-CoA/methylmalonyl-CoA decarboxylase subunit delta
MSLMLPFAFIVSQVLKNSTSSKSAKEFIEFDPYGIAMSIIAMTVVFLALILLYLIFRYISNVYSMKDKRKKNTKKKESYISEDDISGEVVAAISTAIHLYRIQLHDMESFRLTIQRVSKAYSPWSSKLYGLRQVPNRIFIPKSKK